MGTYINPPMDKRQWLDENGEFLLETSDQSNFIKSKVSEIGADEKLVCLVQNFAFDAAAVGTSVGEVEAFNNPDGRNKRWYIVKKEKFLPYI